MTKTFTEFNPTEYLNTSEAISEFMSDALETGNASYIDKATAVITHAKKMTELPSETSPSRKNGNNSSNLR
ncbi:hypothetical protein [Pseudomonas sp. SMN5]|uniref:hypothetical protein n=1 Tax=Pseudomonas sp. SMN5 TaxID=3390198 RepID=UPI003F8364E6